MEIQRLGPMLNLQLQTTCKIPQVIESRQNSNTLQYGDTVELAGEESINT